MASRRKNEAVTVSFHYLTRSVENHRGERDVVPFTVDEFANLATSLETVGQCDLDDDKVKDLVRLKRLVPIHNVNRQDDRIITGTYRAAYWGHAYDNTIVGKIPADSISLRPFYFLLYLSKSGKIYLGVQYLGQFGSYEGIKNTVKRYLPRGKEIVAHSFRHDASQFESLVPSEVQVKIHRKPDSIWKKNAFSEGALVTFRDQNNEYDFGGEVKRRLGAAFGTNIGEAKKAASAIVNDSGLLDVKDEDIVDCTIIGNVNGRRKTIYMISPGVFATPFHISPSFNEDGHPDAKPTIEQMINLLKTKIISVAS